MDQEVLTDAPWVRQDDTQPQAKIRKVTTSRVELRRDGAMTPLRSPLQGNPNRNDRAIVFYDDGFNRRQRPVLEAD